MPRSLKPLSDKQIAAAHAELVSIAMACSFTGDLAFTPNGSVANKYTFDADTYPSGPVILIERVKRTMRVTQYAAETMIDCYWREWSEVMSRNAWRVLCDVAGYSPE